MRYHAMVLFRLRLKALRASRISFYGCLIVLDRCQFTWRWKVSSLRPGYLRIQSFDRARCVSDSFSRTTMAPDPTASEGTQPLPVAPITTSQAEDPSSSPPRGAYLYQSQSQSPTSYPSQTQPQSPAGYSHDDIAKPSSQPEDVPATGSTETPPGCSDRCLYVLLGALVSSGLGLFSLFFLTCEEDSCLRLRGKRKTYFVWGVAIWHVIAVAVIGILIYFVAIRVKDALDNPEDVFGDGLGDGLGDGFGDGLEDVLAGRISDF